MSIDLASIRRRLNRQDRRAVRLSWGEIDELVKELERLTAENAALRAWLRGDLTISDAEIDETLARDAPQQGVTDGS